MGVSIPDGYDQATAVHAAHGVPEGSFPPPNPWATKFLIHFQGRSH
jgi:hypothetical protein